MAGVGPFAVPAGKKNVFVWANDLNPASFQSLEDAVSRNKVRVALRSIWRTLKVLTGTSGRPVCQSIQRRRSRFHSLLGEAIAPHEHQSSDIQTYVPAQATSIARRASSNSDLAKDFQPLRS